MFSVKSIIGKHQDTCTVNINAMGTHLKGWLDFVATFFYLLFLLFSTLCHNLSPCFAKKSRVRIMCLLFYLNYLRFSLTEIFQIFNSYMIKLTKTPILPGAKTVNFITQGLRFYCSASYGCQFL